MPGSPGDPPMLPQVGEHRLGQVHRHRKLMPRALLLMAVLIPPPRRAGSAGAAAVARSIAASVCRSRSSPRAPGARLQGPPRPTLMIPWWPRGPVRTGCRWPPPRPAADPRSPQRQHRQRPPGLTLSRARPSADRIQQLGRERRGQAFDPTGWSGRSPPRGVGDTNPSARMNEPAAMPSAALSAEIGEQAPGSKGERISPLGHRARVGGVEATTAGLALRIKSASDPGEPAPSGPAWSTAGARRRLCRGQRSHLSPPTGTTTTGHGGRASGLRGCGLLDLESMSR